MTPAGTSARLRACAAATLVAVVAGVSACAAADAPPPAEVRLTTAGFDPVRLETPAGTEVRFVNRSEQPQRVTSLGLDDGAPAVPAGADPVDSGRLVAGATHAERLDVPGEYVVEALLDDDATRAVVTIQVKETP
ncbi:cupredoxin domain-containing protein [Promicromonospora aerolata]|uniref:EfeO-type cupredoxin-like domain-containing protein n=1 Tax=Promicromonospora aerolata TaxID=195749 RepID=A0ABW4V752_9MICO